MAELSAAGRIAVDAMGGDLGPAEVVGAAKLALAEYPGLIPLTLVGDVAVLRPLLQKAGLADHPKLTLSHASEIITMDDKPLLAIRRKKDSSMMRAIELVKNGEAIAAVSCGNTGSLVAAGMDRGAECTSVDHVHRCLRKRRPDQAFQRVSHAGVVGDTTGKHQIRFGADTAQQRLDPSGGREMNAGGDVGACGAVLV